MIAHVAAISGRLSLRNPQRRALEILDRVCELVRFEKDTDVALALEAIKAEFPTVADFERDFPSLCFALATGVGKTRLMGAFIAYLYQAENIRHFFVLAPNLTIYNKLTADFTPGTRKYVFTGIAEFAMNPPEIITGDNYESGRGIRKGSLLETDEVHINIFNISKINSEVRGGNSPRIKRLSEYIGESYFKYLSKLDDLVLLMDESHRYRASAGVRAINEHKPILGLELTATPQVERGTKAEPFKNVIYSYPLSEALKDGYVKEPAVATRENFDANYYDKYKDRLEKLKLEDGIRIHEETKVQLEVYARENGQKIVKPFILVVAENTDHANAIVRTMESDEFFEGRYKGRVITVHSAQTGEEKDDTVAQLLTVEDPNNPTEVVVHVNMLKEGWDVTNLYTIVPLRAANSKTLVEQSIGRGLRLPYGKRTGVPVVDRLTIVSHDRFQEIIDQANRPDSIIRTGVVIGRDIPEKRSQVVEMSPAIESRIVGTPASPGQVQRQIFDTQGERQVARVTLDVIKDFERLPRSSDLTKPEIQRQIVEQVRRRLTPAQRELEGIAEEVDIAAVVSKTVVLRNELSIDIPSIIIAPKGEVTCRYDDFDLDASSVCDLPVESNILIHHLRDHARYRLIGGDGVVEEDRLEDYLVHVLKDFDDISYDDHADLLYKLAGQMVRHLRSYLSGEDDVKNVLQYHQQKLVNLIHSQMQERYVEVRTEDEVTVSKGFVTLRTYAVSIAAGEKTRNFREPVDDKLLIRGMVFDGFRKCLYDLQKFHTDSERRFSVVLENDDDDVLKWFKPGRGVFRIPYGRGTETYEPDFVVETKTCKYLCEPKRANEMKDDVVLAKAQAAAVWCRLATEHELAHEGKPWSYMLIPHDAISDNKTVKGLCASFRVPSTPMSNAPGTALVVIRNS